MKLASRRCAGPGCSGAPLGKSEFCRACSHLPTEVRERFLSARRAVVAVKVVPDATWDEYLEARAAYGRALGGETS